MTTIGFDLDGVLYPWHELAYEYLTQDCGVKIPYGPEFWTELERIYSKIFVENLEHYPILYTKADANKADVEVVNTLHKHFDIVYITSRWSDKRTSTYYWLRNNKFPNPENLVMDARDKTLPVRLHKCIYYVEDKPKHLQALDKVTTVIMKRSVYNKHLSDKYYTIDSLEELLEILL